MTSEYIIKSPASIGLCLAATLRYAAIGVVRHQELPSPASWALVKGLQTNAVIQDLCNMHPAVRPVIRSQAPRVRERKRVLRYTKESGQGVSHMRISALYHHASASGFPSSQHSIPYHTIPSPHLPSNHISARAWLFFINSNLHHRLFLLSASATGKQSVFSSLLSGYITPL